MTPPVSTMILVSNSSNSMIYNKVSHDCIYCNMINCKPHLSVSVLGVHASNFQKLVAIKLYISELKYNLEVFTVQMLVED